LKIKIVSVGKDRSGLFAPGVAEYLERLQHYAKTSVVELSESRDEGAALLEQRGKRDLLVALDERGRQLTSPELAHWLGKHLETGKDLTFVVGGDQGLDEKVRAEAVLVLGLSRLTLPHRLARLVLCEQLYRAFTLVRGEPYHK
jgi:23S rRNA (pseudouridine1915-N3)-methyltransferase